MLRLFVGWSKYVAQKRLASEARTRAQDLERALAEERGRREELQNALRRSETERSDLQNALLRVGFGYAPFVDRNDVPAPAPAAEPEKPVNAAENLDAATLLSMTPEQVQRIYTEEAVHKYGYDVRKIRNHVEARLEAYYQFRPRPSALTPEQKAAAADAEAAIAEGMAAARVEGGK